MSRYERRLPIYLLLDCSESMVGEPIEAVHKGLSSLMMDLKSNPLALETVAVSIVTFASTARQIAPLTDVIRFQLPKLKMGSGTALGAALELWMQSMKREVVKTTAEQKGDYKPICFILTDGIPTDNWEAAADKVKTTIVGKQANVIVVACGPDADINKLRRISESVIDLKDVGPGTFKKFFQWVSASVSTASQRIEGAGGAGIGLPALPQDILATEKNRASAEGDRLLFLHAMCVKNRAFYLMKYVKQPDGIYEMVGAYAVDDFEMSEGEGKGLQVSSTLLDGAQPCPYCRNGEWGMCSCGQVHCYPANSGSLILTCPACGNQNRYDIGNFDVGRGQG